ncbi:ABC transporter permease [Demequina sp. TTPB684]|uniref:ABC transporter permease n=1 Tax=unclassified Demequina TaxID=2620311 RepID=UPI001CF4BEF1|nr:MULTISPECIES: ABC transporter permease [unclassified Demequina]MCB2413242.1 ABC transporter permease [Demequina sp. TTPB684]UPU88184.1 ABC transporter permease [Demequina sp. TMPB413]
MNLALTWNTAKRVLTQLRRDPRTLAMLIVLPTGLTWLLQYIFSESPVPPTGPIFNTIGPRIMGLFPLILMFIITSITMLRERQSGTLERLMVGPTGKADVILGYALAFGLIATVQAIAMTAWSVWPLGLEIPTGLWRLGLIMVLDALVGTALGLLASAVARTEFQAVQMMPLVIIPQLLLAGLFVNRSDMPVALEYISNVLPVSYSIDGVNEVLAGNGDGIWGPVAILVAFIAGSLVLGAMTLRRRTD